MYKKFEMELAGRPLCVDVDRVAKQANGAVLMHWRDDRTVYGDGFREAERGDRLLSFKR